MASDDGPIREKSKLKTIEHSKASSALCLVYVTYKENCRQKPFLSSHIRPQRGLLYDFRRNSISVCHIVMLYAPLNICIKKIRCQKKKSKGNGEAPMLLLYKYRVFCYDDYTNGSSGKSILGGVFPSSTPPTSSPLSSSAGTSAPQLSHISSLSASMCSVQ